MRVAIVHHWFVTRGGGERVAELIAALFPRAEIFTLLASPGGLPASLKSRVLHSSFLQKIPFSKSHHRHMMPLYAAAVESLDLRGFDLVVSSDSGPVKGVRVDAGAMHVCYCHSPMRYLYDGFDAYRLQMSPLVRRIFEASAGSLRRWDTASARGVTYFIANSHYVAARIARWYGRESTVIQPPIDLPRARRGEPGAHYLCAGRLVPYKRTELMIEACRRLGRPLRIVGAGPEEARLRRMGHAEMLGELPNEALWEEYARCRALLFAADEDFGMVPLEAQACGRPVIAYGAGGSLETVRGDGERCTGLYFREQSVEAIERAILEFEALDAAGSFDPQLISGWAEGFGTEVFLERLRQFIVSVLPDAEAEMAEPGDLQQR